MRALVSGATVSLVATDLDGTIWDGEGTIHPRTLAALARLEERGIPVVAATARRPSSALRHLSAHGVLVPAVLFDGALGRDFVGRTTFPKQAFDPQTATWVLRTLVDIGIEPCVNVDELTVIWPFGLIDSDEVATTYSQNWV